MFGKLTLVVLGLVALTALAQAQARGAADETEPPGSLIDIDSEVSKEKEEVPEESGSGKTGDDEDDGDDDDLDKSSGSGSGGFKTEEDGGEAPKPTDKPLKGCENLYESSKHLLGNFVPQCDENGEYLPKQCRGHASTGRCWCVDTNGAEIPGTAVEPPNRLDCVTGDSLSPCLFAMVKSVRSSRLGSYRPQCKINGDFESRQCHGSTCFCVDKDGEKQYGTEQPIHKSHDMCKEKTIALPDHTVKGGIILNEDKTTQTPLPTKPEFIVPTKKDVVEVEAPASEGEKEQQPDKTRSPNATGDEEDDDGPKKEEAMHASTPIMTQPGLLAAIIGGAVVGLLCAILLVMFIVYRMRKKDEGSYALDEPRKKSTYSPINQTDKEYYA